MSPVFAPDIQRLIHARDLSARAHRAARVDFPSGVRGVVAPVSVGLGHTQAVAAHEGAGRELEDAIVARRLDRPSFAIRPRSADCGRFQSLDRRGSRRRSRFARWLRSRCCLCDRARCRRCLRSAGARRRCSPGRAYRVQRPRRTPSGWSRDPCRRTRSSRARRGPCPPQSSRLAWSKSRPLATRSWPPAGVTTTGVALAGTFTVSVPGGKLRACRPKPSPATIPPSAVLLRIG